MPRTSPFETASAAIARAIAGRPEAGRRLPAIVTLARDAGVSVVTMWKAVREAVRRGELSAAPRRGLVVVSPARTFEPEQQAVRRVTLKERIMALCYERAASGMVDLPSHKHMCLEYGCGHRVLAKALQELSGSGRLERHGRGYRLRGVLGRRPNARVVLLGWQSTLAGTAKLTERTAEFCAHLERECSRRGLRLEVSSTDGSAERGQSQTAQNEDSVLGTIVLTAGMETNQRKRAFAQCRRSTRAVVVVDIMGNRSVVVAPGGRPAWTVVRVDDHRTAGRMVAEHMLQRVRTGMLAYISPYVRFDWCRERLAGVREVVRDAGREHDLAVFTDTTLENYDQVRRRIEENPRFSSVTDAVDAIGRFACECVGPRPPDLLEPHVIPELIDRSIEAQVWGLFEQAERQEGVRGWIVTNDMVALLALRFLRARPAVMRKQVLVAGFDDTFAASMHDLTSYSFNVPVVVQAALSELTAPRPRSTRTREIVVPGFIVQRGSTG